MEGPRSVARFADGLLALSCDPTTRQVTIARRGGAAGRMPHAVPMTVLSLHETRPLSGTTSAAPPHDVISVTLSANDRLLDAMAFSRGRFAIETAGLPTLYVPSWAEVSRVVEDCR